MIYEHILHNIIDDMSLFYKNNIYHNDLVDSHNINNKNVISIFEESYMAFIHFLKFNILIEKSYDMDENINKYSKLYLNLLYDVIYRKASYEEELLNELEYGDFFEYYKNYTPSKNINIVSNLNEIYNELENIEFSLINLNILKDYVLKFANLYILLTNDN